MQSRKDGVSPTGRSKNAPTVGEIIGQQDDHMNLGSYGYQEKQSAQAHFYNQQTFTEMVEKYIEPQPEPKVIEIPVLSPKRSMICSSRSYHWMEQEINEESHANNNMFKRSLEVIEEQSMEVNEEKEEQREPTKLHVIDSILEVNQQSTEASSPYKKIQSHASSLVTQSTGNFEELFLNIVKDSTQEQKLQLEIGDEPEDILSKDLVQSEYESEFDSSQQLKELFHFKIPQRLNSIKLGIKDIVNRHVDPFEDFSYHEEPQTPKDEPKEYTIEELLFEKNIEVNISNQKEHITADIDRLQELTSSFQREGFIKTSSKQYQKELEMKRKNAQNKEIKIDTGSESGSFRSGYKFGEEPKKQPVVKSQFGRNISPPDGGEASKKSGSRVPNTSVGPTRRSLNAFKLNIVDDSLKPEANDDNLLRSSSSLVSRSKKQDITSTLASPRMSPRTRSRRGSHNVGQQSQQMKALSHLQNIGSGSKPKEPDPSPKADMQSILSIQPKPKKESKEQIDESVLSSEEEEISNLFESYQSGSGLGAESNLLSKQDSHAHMRMHEMMVLDGQDLDEFMDQHSQDNSISLVSLDFEPGTLSEEIKEKMQWQGISMTTLLFPSEKLDQFEKEQMDLKISKPKEMRYVNILNNYIKNSWGLFVVQPQMKEEIDYLCYHRKHFILINETLSKKLSLIKLNRFQILFQKQQVMVKKQEIQQEIAQPGIDFKQLSSILSKKPTQVAKKNKTEVKNEAVEFLKALNININQQTVLNPENYVVKPMTKAELKKQQNQKTSIFGSREKPEISRRYSMSGERMKMPIIGGEESMLAISNFILRQLNSRLDIKSIISQLINSEEMLDQKYIMVFHSNAFKGSNHFNKIKLALIYYEISFMVCRINNEYFNHILNQKLDQYSDYSQYIHQKLQANKSDNRISIFDVGIENLDKCRIKHKIVDNLLQPRITIMYQMKLLIFQNKRRQVRKMIHKAFQDENYCLLPTFRQLYIQACQKDDTYKYNIKDASNINTLYTDEPATERELESEVKYSNQIKVVKQLMKVTYAFTDPGTQAIQFQLTLNFGYAHYIIGNGLYEQFETQEFGLELMEKQALQKQLELDYQKQIERQKLRNQAKSKIKGVASLLALRNNDSFLKVEESKDDQVYVVRKDSNGNIVKQPKNLNATAIDSEKYVATPSNPHINFTFKKNKLKRTSSVEQLSIASDDKQRHSQSSKNLNFEIENISEISKNNDGESITKPKLERSFSHGDDLLAKPLIKKEIDLQENSELSIQIESPEKTEILSEDIESISAKSASDKSSAYDIEMNKCDHVFQVNRKEPLQQIEEASNENSIDEGESQIYQQKTLNHGDLVIARDMFGRSLSKDRNNKINVMNMSLTSYGGKVTEEKTEMMSERSNSQSVVGGTSKGGNMPQASNLLSELIYEIISDGELETRPPESLQQHNRQNTIRKLVTVIDFDKVQANISEVLMDLTHDDILEQSFNQKLDTIKKQQMVIPPTGNSENNMKRKSTFSPIVPQSYHIRDSTNNPFDFKTINNKPIFVIVDDTKIEEGAPPTPIVQETPMVKLAQEKDVIDKFDLIPYDQEIEDNTAPTPKIEKRRESFNRKATIVIENVEQEVQDEETLKLEQKQKVEKLKKNLKKKILNGSLQSKKIKFSSQKELEQEAEQQKFHKLQQMNKGAKIGKTNLQSKVKKMMKNQKGLAAIEKFNQIQVKAASTITRKTEEAVGIEWAKCKSAIENNFSQPIQNFVLFNSQHIDRMDQQGYTLLCLAVHYGRVEMVDVLLKNGASPTIQTKESDGKNTPLHIAVNFKFKKIQDLLIEAGADENMLNLKGLTPWEGFI